MDKSQVQDNNHRSGQGIKESNSTSIAESGKLPLLVAQAGKHWKSEYLDDNRLSMSLLVHVSLT